MEQQQHDLELILQNQNDDKAVQNAEKISAWLQSMFSPDVDALHDLLRKKRRPELRTAKTFVSDVEDWLANNSSMIYWKRGLRKHWQP